MNHSDSECIWKSKTDKIKYPIFLRQYADALAFEIECPEKSILRLSLSCGDRKREISLTTAEILNKSSLIFMEDIPPDNLSNYWSSMKTHAKFKIYHGYRTDNLTVNLTWKDNSPDSPKNIDDFYYIRLLQKNGQRAWSSPIWVKK